MIFDFNINYTKNIFVISRNAKQCLLFVAVLNCCVFHGFILMSILYYFISLYWISVEILGRLYFCFSFVLTLHSSFVKTCLTKKITRWQTFAVYASHQISGRHAAMLILMPTIKFFGWYFFVDPYTYISRQFFLPTSI